MTQPSRATSQNSHGLGKPETVPSRLPKGVTFRAVSIAEAMTIFESLQFGDLRDCEQVELMDVLGRFKCDPADFGYLLMTFMGFSRRHCTAYGAFMGNDLVFLASSALLSNGERILCGVGMRQMEPFFDKYARLEIMNHIVKELILNNGTCQSYRCNVSNENTQVLRLWKSIQKFFEGNLEVTFEPTTQPKPNYTLVKLRTL